MLIETLVGARRKYFEINESVNDQWPVEDRRVSWKFWRALAGGAVSDAQREHGKNVPLVGNLLLTGYILLL